MHVRVNAATSVDGKLSNRRREQVAISGQADFGRVDELRRSVDAVVVGIGTVLADDPSLAVDQPVAVDQAIATDQSVAVDQAIADGDGEADVRATGPARVVADSRARTPLDARVLDDTAPTYVLVADAAPADRVAALEAADATVVRAGAERVALPAAFDALEGFGIDSALVEGGGELIYSLFAAGLVDELRLYVGSTILGGRDAPTLVDGEGFVDDPPALELVDVERIDDGVALSYRVP